MTPPAARAMGAPEGDASLAMQDGLDIWEKRLLTYHHRNTIDDDRRALVVQQSRSTTQTDRWLRVTS